MADNEQLALVADGPGVDAAIDPSDEVTDLGVRVAGVLLAESVSAEPASVVVETADVEKVSAPSAASEVSQPVPSTESVSAGADSTEVHTAEAAVQSTKPVPSTEPLASTEPEQPTQQEPVQSTQQEPVQSTQQEPVQSTPAVQSTEPVESSTASVQSLPQSSPEAQSSSVQEGKTAVAEASPESGQTLEKPASASDEVPLETDTTPTATEEKTPKTPKDKKFSFCKTS